MEGYNCDTQLGWYHSRANKGGRRTSRHPPRGTLCNNLWQKTQTKCEKQRLVRTHQMSIRKTPLNYCILQTYYVPRTVCKMLYKTSHLILLVTLHGKYCYPHCTDGGTTSTSLCTNSEIYHKTKKGRIGLKQIK